VESTSVARGESQRITMRRLIRDGQGDAAKGGELQNCGIMSSVVLPLGHFQGPETLDFA